MQLGDTETLPKGELGGETLPKGALPIYIFFILTNRNSVIRSFNSTVNLDSIKPR